MSASVAVPLATLSHNRSGCLEALARPGARRKKLGERFRIAHAGECELQGQSVPLRRRQRLACVAAATCNLVPRYLHFAGQPGPDVETGGFAWLTRRRCIAAPATALVLPELGNQP